MRRIICDLCGAETPEKKSAHEEQFPVKSDFTKTNYPIVVALSVSVLRPSPDLYPNMQTQDLCALCEMAMILSAATRIVDRSMDPPESNKVSLALVPHCGTCGSQVIPKESD